ncbi:ABA4-like family protein [Plantactinospora sp. CA-290183]|uniref:ABA4-like family protein n=1 Tax=Plantactinospora sp. CA-290183 TaxID=3240006 RepID=UPI003D931236
MSTLLFGLVFPLVVPFWTLMILAPGWSRTRRIIASPWIVAPPLVVYAMLTVPHLDVLWPAVTAPTLDGLRDALAVPALTAAAWAHFVAFDLFVGRWMYRDSRERRVHPLVMAPLLVLTILLAPLGLLGYLLVRSARPAAAPATARKTERSAGVPAVDPRA